MSDEVIIARPYAKALFDFACKTNNLSAWSALLNQLAVIAADERVVALIKSPKMRDEKIAQMMMDIVKQISSIDEHGKNFLKLLAKNHRLAMLPKIADRYEYFRAQYEKIVDVEVTSSYPLTEKQQQDLAQALEKKFKQKVAIQFVNDVSLLGGAIIRVGDFVIDDSIKGKLLRLSNHLNLKEKVCQ